MLLPSIITYPWPRLRPVVASEGTASQLGRSTARINPRPGVGQVNDFVDWLAEVPCTEWLAIGRSLADDRSKLAARGYAWDSVQAAIADHGVRVAAWYIRDAVETCAYLASHGARRWSRDDRRMFAAAHGAAESAALAIWLRPFLAPEHFATLCAPFAYGPQFNSATSSP